MKKLGIGISGSFCNLQSCLEVYKKLKEDYEITFFTSYNVQKTSNRFIEYEKFKEELLKIGTRVVEDLTQAEKYGPFLPLDIFLFMPLSSTSLGKLKNGIYDTPPLLASKAHLRGNKPLVIGIASNDYLGISGANLFSLINYKHIYLIPFSQDDPFNKPQSLVCDFKKAKRTLDYALEEIQIQPLLI